MPLPRFGFTIFVLLISVAATCPGQERKEKPFPTNDEINLLITQADRAIQQYKPLIDQQEALLGKDATEAASKDRGVVNTLEMAVKALKSNPQGFNTPAGFTFSQWLDHADRNTLLCETAALSQSTVSLMDGDINKAKELLHLSQSCASVEALIYTVSESAGSLYDRYLEAQHQVLIDLQRVAQNCVETLKKKNPEKN